jgi:hypothetical protein
LKILQVRSKKIITKILPTNMNLICSEISIWQVKTCLKYLIWWVPEISGICYSYEISFCCCCCCCCYRQLG